MKLIISPAKKMRMDTDTLPPAGLPVFVERAERLRDYLQGLSLPQLKRLLACNDDIAALNFGRFQSMELRRGLTPAILAYDGIQYKYMAPQVFERAMFDYVQAHLYILSGFYGILRPLDGVTPYRLEMQARLKTEFCSDLYDYWGGSLYRELTREDDTVLDLASQEYSRAAAPYRDSSVRWITCLFGELAGDRLVEKGVYVKMARGEMVRYLAERGAEVPEEAKGFDRLGFTFCPERSEENTYVFVKT